VDISGVSNGSTVAAGSVLSCSAEGRPPPTYHLTAVTGDVEVTGSSVTVRSANTYYVLTCTANNTITHADGREEPCSTSSTVYFNSEFSTELYFYLFIITPYGSTAYTLQCTFSIDRRCSKILHTKLTFPAIQFLPRDTMRTLSVVFAIVRCSSVCLSITLMHCIHVAEDIVKLLI